MENVCGKSKRFKKIAAKAEKYIFIRYMNAENGLKADQNFCTALENG